MKADKAKADLVQRTRLNGAIRRALYRSNDLRKPKYRDSRNAMRGHCYVASEAAYHIFGAEKSGWKPCVMKVGEDNHWFLRRNDGKIFDPTWDQFDFTLDYDKAIAKGFLTKKPSKRAEELIKRVERGFRS